MDFGTMSSWVAIGVTLVLAIYTWYAHAQRTTKGDIADVQSQIDKQAISITQLQTEMKSLPTKDAFHQLELAVTEVKGGMNVLEAEIRPIALAVRRIEQFLIDTPHAVKKR